MQALSMQKTATIIMKIKTYERGPYLLTMAKRLLEEMQTGAENKRLALAWERAMFARGNKETSRGNRLLALYWFLKWKPSENLKETTSETMVEFKEYMTTTLWSLRGSKPKKYSQISIEQRLFSIKMFFDWQGRTGLMDWLKIKRNVNGRLKAHEILSQQDILALVNAANSHRTKALIMALWETGCRAGEFLALRIGSLHFDGNTISFTVDGKTGERQCFLVAAVPSLLEYLEEHPFKNDKNAWLWHKQNNNGTPLTVNGLRAILLATAKRANINKPVFPHSFRHSRATFAAKAGQNEMVMRELFGWSKTSNMPAVYVSLSGTDAKNAVLEMAGVKQAPEKEKQLQVQTCVRCGTVAPVDALVCKSCFFPLNQEGAMKQEQAQVSSIKAMIDAALDEREKKR